MKQKEMKLKRKIFMTETFYKLVRAAGKNIVLSKYKPLIINSEIIPNENESIVYAPNHRSTLDPFFLIATIKDPIHWGALKRFFDGEDSIFNNSKNFFLRKLTVALFKGIGAVPIDRGETNMQTVRDLNSYLKAGTSIGIFPEGTTNKTPNEKDLEEKWLAKGVKGITTFAKMNDAWIQPIAIVWTPKDVKIENRLVVNFLEPYKVSDISKEEACEKYETALRNGINHNKQIIADLIALKEDVNNTAIENKIKVKVRRMK
ncbi:MAG: 1-acyl-sn-glycerol-3-phosphate acyltransferase [Fusobacteriaceae bacterium]|nr:1-acyl-sn-glycerol-3-phosphate acyltransferase [Fusobacteriaceae bacterium]